MKKLSLILAALVGAALPAQAADEKTCETCSECCAEGREAGLLKNYVEVSNALAADNLKDAQSAAECLECCLNCADQGDVATKVESFRKASDIAAARAAFKGISASIIPLLKGAGDHYIMTCPMARADWVQTDATVNNPYYGASMLHCGAVKQAVKSDS